MKRAATHGEESLNAFAVIVIGIDFTRCMQARGYTVRKGAQHMIAAIYTRKSPEQDTRADLARLLE
jgi:hypothetical protein